MYNKAAIKVSLLRVTILQHSRSIFEPFAYCWTKLLVSSILSLSKFWCIYSFTPNIFILHKLTSRGHTSSSKLQVCLLLQNIYVVYPSLLKWQLVCGGTTWHQCPQDIYPIMPWSMAATHLEHQDQQSKLWFITFIVSFFQSLYHGIGFFSR